MSRVICDLPNASLEISGVRFQKLEDGRFISDEIGDEATALFLSIPGYALDEDAADDLPPPEKPPVARTKAQIAADKKAADKAAAKAAPKTPVETPVVIDPVDPVDPVIETPVIDPANPVDPVPGAGDNDPVNPEDTADKPADVF